MKKTRKKTIKNAKGQKLSIRRTGWFKPYIVIKGKRRATLPFITKAECGVYIIRSKRSRKILYVGHSGKQLYKTLYRHFQDWSSSSQYRTTYKRPAEYEIMVITTRACLNAYMIEQFYHHKLKPRDGLRKLEVPKSEIVFSGMPNPAIIKDDWTEVAPF